MLSAILVLAGQGFGPVNLAQLAGQKFNLDKNHDRYQWLSDFVDKNFPSPAVDFLMGGGPNIYVWRNGGRYVVFEEIQTYSHPGENEALVSIFDTAQKPVSQTRMNVGYRSLIEGTKAQILAGVSGLTLRMEVMGERGGGNRLYFGFDKDRLALLRVDDTKDGYARNEYTYPNWTFGPLPPLYSQADLAAILQGSNRLKQLEAMTWLAGVHSPTYLSYPWVYAEQLPYASRANELSQDPQIRKAVSGLAAASDKWLSQAAKAFEKDWKPIAAAKGHGVKVTDKLRIEDLVVGKGSEFIPSSRTVGINDDITVSYIATLPDGTKVNGSPIQLGTMRLRDRMCIEGLTRGILGMRVGGRRKLTIPSDLAYGSLGTGPVPPNCDVIYTVKLHYIETLPHPSVNHSIDVKKGTGRPLRAGDTVSYRETRRRLDGNLIYAKRLKTLTLSDSYGDDLNLMLKGMLVGGVRKAVLGPLSPDDSASQIFEVEVMRIVK